MSVFQTVLARCFKCGSTSVQDGAYGASKSVVIQLAKNAGWTFGDYDLSPKCPRCNKEGDS